MALALARDNAITVIFMLIPKQLCDLMKSGCAFKLTIEDHEGLSRTFKSKRTAPPLFQQMVDIEGVKAELPDFMAIAEGLTEQDRRTQGVRLDADRLFFWVRGEFAARYPHVKTQRAAQTLTRMDTGTRMKHSRWCYVHPRQAQDAKTGQDTRETVPFVALP